MKKTLIFLLSYFSITMLLSAQERIILRSNGEQIKISNSKDLREAITETKLTNLKGKTAQSVFPTLKNTNGIIDTFNYRQKGGAFNTNFGFNGQDIMMMWFEAEADMDIKAIGFKCSDDEGSSNATVQMWLMRLNWTKEQLNNFERDTYMGYYPSTGDSFNESDYFGEEATGNWVSKNSNNPLPPWTDNADPAANTWDYQLWYPTGFQWPVTPVESDVDNPIYNWVEVGYTTSVKQGDIFAVVVLHDGTNLDSDRIGFWSDNTIGYPGWKYYENGRLSSDEAGWWVRMYTWDFAVAAEFPNPPILFSDVTILKTTLSTESRKVDVTIYEDNPNGESNIAEVNLLYSINGGDFNTIAMTADGEVYSAQIPGQQPGTVVAYSFDATDINNNYTRWARDVTYNIFEVKNNTALLVFNGLDGATGYPQSYYFGSGDWPNSFTPLEWNYDTWAFGELTEELVNNYSNILEITTKGPSNINNDVISVWLAGGASRNYMLAGDEWLGAQSSWTNQEHEAGSFHNDILGISFEYNDINYAKEGDQALASEVNAIEGSLLGGKLFELHQQISADSGWTSSILYDPTYELGGDNWLDGVDFVDDVEVDMTGIGIDGNTFNIAGHRTLVAGNKVAFLAFDPLSLNSHNEAGDDEYYWYGFTQEAPHVQALSWFDAVVGVEEDGTLPETFSLSQNYPNPFNPSTTIKYSIPIVDAKFTYTTKLIIYDILGREIATLVNEVQKAGNYEVQFNASNLTSGIYFYKLHSGNFAESRKMILLR